MEVLVTCTSSRGIHIANVERQVGDGEETTSTGKTHQELPMIVKMKDREVLERGLLQGWFWNSVFFKVGEF